MQANGGAPVKRCFHCEVHAYSCRAVNDYHVSSHRSVVLLRCQKLAHRIHAGNCLAGFQAALRLHKR